MIDFFPPRKIVSIGSSRAFFNLKLIFQLRIDCKIKVFQILFDITEEITQYFYTV